MGFSCGSTGSEERTEEIIYLIYSHWSPTNNMHWQCCFGRQGSWTAFPSWLTFCSKFHHLQKFFPLIKSTCTPRVSPQHLWISEKTKLVNCDEQLVAAPPQNHHHISGEKSSHRKRSMSYCFKYQAAIGGRHKPCTWKSKGTNVQL